MPRIVTIIGIILMIIAVLIGINGTSETPNAVARNVLGTAVCRTGERFIRTNAPDIDASARSFSCQSPGGQLRDVTLMSYLLSFVLFVVLVGIGLYMTMWGLKRSPSRKHRKATPQMQDYLATLSSDIETKPPPTSTNG